MIELKHVSKYYFGTPALKDVSLSIDKGELIGVVGPSGSGKSVLLKVLGRVTAPEDGEILGSETSVGFLFQEGALFDSMSVLDNVAFSLTTEKNNLEKDVAYEKSFKVLCRVGLGKHYHKHPGQLSGGMKRRAALARAIVSKPDLVLLDDPTGGLDPVAASAILQLILEFHQDYNPAVVMVSHDIRRLLPRVDRLISMFDGRIESDCAVSELPQALPQNVIEFLQKRYDFNVQHVSE